MKTLQEKIDAICPFHKEKNKVCEYCTVRENQNKAIQELREEIQNTPTKIINGIEYIPRTYTLLLIGEKK